VTEWRRPFLGHPGGLHRLSPSIVADATGQAIKKIEESENDDFTTEQVLAELRGAITYIASAIYLIEQGLN
jgi:hypothetical protein